MPRQPNPIDDELLYTDFTLGRTASPGYITSISGHDSKVNWDVKDATGQDGGSVTLKSVPLRTVKIDIKLSDEEDFAAWDDFRAVIDSTVAGRTPTALEIYHPDITAAGITSVVKSNISGAKHDGKGRGHVHDRAAGVPSAEAEGWQPRRREDEEGRSQRGRRRSDVAGNLIDEPQQRLAEPNRLLALRRREKTELVDSFVRQLAQVIDPMGHRLGDVSALLKIFDRRALR